jgi:microcystin-dependent protein
MKKITTSAAGWIVATIALSALVLMGVSGPATGPANTAVDQAENYSMEPFLGEISMFAGVFAPIGWAFCDGRLLSISENAALFSILGTTYGGDGRTTFALPDLRGRVAIHPGQGPGLSDYDLGQAGGTETVEYQRMIKVAPAGSSQKSTAVGVGGNSNIQPYVTVNYIIALQGIYPSRN